MEGQTWYWVPEFVCPKGTFTGMYMTHRSGSEHQEWLRKKKYWADKKRRCDDGGANAPESTTSGSGGLKLVSSDKLKEALMTSHGMLEMQADAFLASLN